MVVISKKNSYKKAPLFPPGVDIKSMEENMTLNDVLEAVAQRYVETKAEEKGGKKKKGR